MTIVESMREAFDLVMKGLQIKEVNVGGLRYKDGAREIAPYIYLSPKDIKSAVKIYKLGVKVIGRQLPNSPPIDVMKCLAGII
jgi:mannose/fructose/N-acetylgalactosamine-specific phosphotransferase system component IIB